MTMAVPIGVLFKLAQQCGHYGGLGLTVRPMSSGRYRVAIVQVPTNEDDPEKDFEAAEDKDPDVATIALVKKMRDQVKGRLASAEREAADKREKFDEIEKVLAEAQL